MTERSMKTVSPAVGASVTRRLAEYASSLRYEDLSEEARTVARHCLLDWLGVTLAGASTDTARLIRDEALSEGAAPRATILGSAERTSPALAALVNGTAGHALDYDDVHMAMPGHPTVPVAPAILALAEIEGTPGRELVAALVAGVEVECRVGRALTWEHYQRGFHATGTLGTIGAAAVCSRLLGLDPDQTAAALGIAATQAAGLKSMFGTDCKPLHAGRAAMWGLQAASLARRGFTSRPDVIECEQGFAETHSGAFDPEAALAGLGQAFEIRDTLFKYHAACYGTHATIDALRALRELHQIEPGAVERVEARVPEDNLRMCNIERPETGLEAKFSLRLTAAMALAGRDTAAIDAYDAGLCADPGLVSLRDRVRVMGDPALGHMSSEVVVTLRNGATLQGTGDSSSPAVDLGDQGRRLKAKFRSLAIPVVGAEAAVALDELVDRIDTLDNPNPLLAQLGARS
jgi:2-methylcitrate dehydratase PrpD